MTEIMIDLETLNTSVDAVVLSIGAVAWDTEEYDYRVVGRFYRVIGFDGQLKRRRSVSEDTVLWWMDQDQDARDEAFSPNRRPVEEVIRDFGVFCAKHNCTRFWASPATFDFPIWEHFSEQSYGREVPWRYNQKYDVRTVMTEANYSAKDHVPSRMIAGKAHMPVTDCECQIDLLQAARVKVGRRMSKKNP